MEPGTLTELGTAVVALLALGVSVVAIVRGEKATKAAERSAVAAEQAEARGHAAAERDRVILRIERLPDRRVPTFALVNMGTDTAERVTLAVPRA
jgi:uncharacterized protein HemX